MTARGLLATAALSLVAGGAAGQALPPGADACVAALTATGQGAGSDENARFAGDVCPEFVAALEASAWADSLPAGEAAFLTGAGITGLRELVAAYAGPEAASGPDDTPLATIVAELEPFRVEPPPSLWQQLVDWVEGLFSSEDSGDSWFSDWLSAFEIPASWTEVILYSILVLIGLTVLAILINELRLGGAFAARTTQALRAAVTSRFTPPAARAPTFDDIRVAPSLGRKVELLFVLTLDRLSHGGVRLRPGATHREIARAAAGLDADARQRLSAVAGAAERVTYAAWEPADSDWQDVLASGEDLLRRFENGAPGSPGKRT